MSVAAQQARASFAFAERNWNLVKRYWAWELVWLAYSIANSLAVSYIGLGMEVLTGGAAANTSFLVLYLLIGTLVWRFLSSIFYWVTEVIAIERWEGTIEYTLMAPVPRLVHLIGHTAFAVVYSMVFTGVILAVTVVLFDLDRGAHAAARRRRFCARPVPPGEGGAGRVARRLRVRAGVAGRVGGAARRRRR